MDMKYTFLLIISLIPRCTEGQTTTQVRLADGNSTAGRVEVFHNGTWRQVCDDCFEIPEAWAICQMLNFTNGGVPIPNHWNESADFWIDDLSCACGQTIDTGCIFRPWGQHDCSAYEAVAVTCYDEMINPQPTCAPSVLTGESKCLRLTTLSPSTFSSAAVGSGNVRLIGPPVYLGIGCVEYYYNGAWGSVCDDFLGTNNARVICRQLGYDANEARAGIRAEFNHYRQNVSSVIVLDDVRCNGTEARIDQCPHSPFGVHNCSANEILCVSCQQPNEATPEVPVPSLQCNNGTISASFSRISDSNLTERHLSVLSGYCPYATTSSDTNFVTINIPFDRCNTRIKTNDTHIVYYNTIWYNYTGTNDIITRIYVSEVEVSCVFPRDLEASNVVRPLPEAVTQEAPGLYDMQIQFFLNNSFENPVRNTPVNLTIGEWLNAALTLEAVRTDLKLVVIQCVATPSTNQYDAVSYPLFIDKCERENTLTFVPLNSTSFGFRYQTFMFPHHELVYIHCDAIVCLQSENMNQCDRSCNRPSTAGIGRRRRDTDDDDDDDDSLMVKELYHLRSPPLRLRQQDGFNYIITDHNVTATGVLRREEPLNKAVSNQSVKTTSKINTEAEDSNSPPVAMTTAQAKLFKPHHTKDPMAKDHISVLTTQTQASNVEVDFNYDEPYVAGLGGFLRSSSELLTYSCMLISLCHVVVVQTIW